MQLNTSANWLLSLLSISLLLSPTHAQTSNTAAASINPTATNVALATQAVAQIAKNNTSGFLSDALNGVPGFLKSVDQAITGAVAETKDQLKKILAPELYYSYGRSPPVYPTRKFKFPIMQVLYLYFHSKNHRRRRMDGRNRKGSRSCRVVDQRRESQSHPRIHFNKGLQWLCWPAVEIGIRGTMPAGQRERRPRRSVGQWIRGSTQHRCFLEPFLGLRAGTAYWQRAQSEGCQRCAWAGESRPPSIHV
jgi:hypothetical protein